MVHTPGRARPRRWLTGLAVLTLVLSVGAVTAGAVTRTSSAEAAPQGTKDVTAVLFSWRFDSVARECRDTLGPLGYGYVQVSPPQEHIQGSQWWTQYQPVSYTIAGRLGGRTAFKAMVDTCHAAGVKVIVDAVINHMSAGSGTGTGGTTYAKYHYPGVYQAQDFHSCRTRISDYRNRYDVQECELVDLADLHTGTEYVRNRIAAYLSDLLALGVDGFRIDAAKHIAAADLAAIRSKMSNPNAYWIQEVIHGAGEAVQPGEYTGTGDVQEFRYARDLRRIFLDERLAYLRTIGPSWGYLPSGQAGVFVDNHDTERVGDTLNYKNGATYTLASVFTLAWNYGAPHVHSGYEFSDFDAGPPNGGTVVACYADGWRCQHKWRQIANMVKFRTAAHGTGVVDWWDNGNDQIAFGRGDRAFVVINKEGSTLTRTFQTSLPAGTYCDVQHGDPTSGGGCTGPTVTVNTAGRFTASVGPNDALAVHVGAGGPGTSPAPSTGPSSAAFAVTATTVWGQNIFVVGDHGALGGWDPARAVPLSSAGYPVWRGTVSLPAGTTFGYKYLRKNADGTVTWESGGNRTGTTPASGTVTLTDTWRN
ncbi:carbohydrate-binding module family 20 domain-containing protein [Solwaraspora sp. WMMD406]|uniref:carbohydrate-binding module family 20 domain-containing protein n=1 Tax=Solwaraspora sp. WMMD406 TaxID=3016095 RepID=UPI0024166A21|nr:carbohydrate-binding module family 20 domain-containing protein [Solwaraspora sp. WMMD406]MDG4765451.1 carbohydrate-binding module family 20 domain-containing protein [Solwaraspora sp. WMMD406]